MQEIIRNEKKFLGIKYGKPKIIRNQYGINIPRDKNNMTTSKIKYFDIYIDYHLNNILYNNNDNYLNSEKKIDFGKILEELIKKYNDIHEEIIKEICKKINRSEVEVHYLYNMNCVNKIKDDVLGNLKIGILPDYYIYLNKYMKNFFNNRLSYIFNLIFKNKEKNIISDLFENFKTDNNSIKIFYNNLSDNIKKKNNYINKKLDNYLINKNKDKNYIYDLCKYILINEIINKFNIKILYGTLKYNDPDTTFSLKYKIERLKKFKQNNEQNNEEKILYIKLINSLVFYIIKYFKKIIISNKNTDENIKNDTYIRTFYKNNINF